jgi:hypothetical protein
MPILPVIKISKEKIMTNLNDFLETLEFITVKSGV